MLKTAVHYGAEQFWFKEEISESRAVDGHIGSLHLLLACGDGTLGGSLWLLVLLIVQQLIINIMLCHLLGENAKLGMRLETTALL